MKTSEYFYKVDCTCPVCNKAFQVKPSHAELTTYCSTECMAIGYKIRMRGENNPNYKGVIKICQHCGCEYRNYSKSSRYCSGECYHKSRMISDQITTGSLWKKANRHKVQGYAQKRRHIKRNLKSDFTPEEWTICLKYWDYRCAYCGKREGLFAFSRIQQDHFIPVSDSSTTNPGYTRTNIVPACCSCNTAKSKSDPREWIVSRFGKRKGNQIIKRIEQYFENWQGQAAIVRTVEGALEVVGL